MPTLVNLDGQLVPPAEAVISIFDRGFLAGDQVYEVVRTYGLRPFELGAHFARMVRSAARLALPLPWDEARLERELARTLEASRGGDPEDAEAAPWNRGERSARLVATRGGGEAARALGIEAGPRAVITVQPLAGPPARAYREGVRCLLVGARTPRFDPEVKSGRHQAEEAAGAEARAAGADEALLLDERGQVTEGASSNLFLVRRGVLRTTAAGRGILPGVTRGLVLELARRAAVPVEEAVLTPPDLAEADELFLTSTSREVLPVTWLGGAPAGGGRVGPVTARLHALFREYVTRAAGPR